MTSLYNKIINKLILLVFSYEPNKEKEYSKERK